MLCVPELQSIIDLKSYVFKGDIIANIDGELILVVDKNDSYYDIE